VEDPATRCELKEYTPSKAELRQEVLDVAGKLGHMGIQLLVVAGHYTNVYRRFVSKQSDDAGP